MKDILEEAGIKSVSIFTRSENCKLPGCPVFYIIAVFVIMLQ